MKTTAAKILTNLKPALFMLMGALTLVIAGFLFWLSQNWDVQQKCMTYPEAVRQTPISVQVTINNTNDSK